MKQSGLRFTIANTDWDALRRSVQQAERRPIAQQLHDTVLQGFTGIALKQDERFWETSNVPLLKEFACKIPTSPLKLVNGRPIA